jgi:peptide/nickel transport system substrate-binding protein
MLRVEIAGAPWQGTGGLARRLVLDGLTALNATGAVRPALAATWESGDNNHRWKFGLRPGVHFHDGSPLTAAAVVMSLNLSCNGNCPWSAVRAVGPSSIVFTSDSPLPDLPVLLAGDAFLIQLTRSADGQTPSQPTGTGPFRVVASAANTITLSANEDCWQGRPFLDQVVLTAHRSVRDQWLDMEVGRADVVEVPADQLRQAQQQRMTIVTSPPVMLLALEISASGAVSNPMLRSAIAYAVDRNALFNVIFQKQGEVTASILPQSLSGYSFLFPADRDLNKANELRGGLNPPPLALWSGGDGTMQLTAQRLALNLHEAGFNVQMTANAQRADLVLTELPIAGSDPAGVLATLLERAGQQPFFVADNPEVLYRAERDVLDQHTIVPLLDLPKAWSVSGRVHNFCLDADGTPGLASVSVEDAP